MNDEVVELTPAHWGQTGGHMLHIGDQNAFPLLLQFGGFGLKFKALLIECIIHQEKENSKTDLRFHKGLIT